MEHIIKTEKTFESIGGQWIAEHYIVEGKGVFTRDVHIDNKTGNRTYESDFIKINPWSHGVEIERIKNLPENN